MYINLLDIIITNEMKESIGLKPDKINTSHLLPISKQRLQSIFDSTTPLEPIKVHKNVIYPYIPKPKLRSMGLYYLSHFDQVTDLDQPINNPTVSYDIIDGRHRTIAAILRKQTTIKASVVSTTIGKFHTIGDAIVLYIKSIS